MSGAQGRAFAFAFLAPMLLLAAPAWGAVRYAEPGVGGSNAACPQTDPCDLQQAVESAMGGDEVIVTAGTYNEGGNEVTVPAGVNVHGAAAGPGAVIVSNSVDEAVQATGAGARLADLAIDYSGTSAGLRMSNGNVGERLYVKSSGTVACNVLNATLRDSVCWDTGLNGNAIFNSTAAPTTVTTTLRNVTAVATGANSDGIEIISGGGLTHNVDAKNVIVGGVVSDARAEAGASSMTAITFDHSNYDTTDTGGTGTSSVTPAGSPTGQTAPPAFAAPITGDFHQTNGSPTIDAGIDDPSLGSADIDGESRSQGSAPDIGADEFTVPPAANGDNFPPDTKILKGPRDRTKKRKAKFQFGGSEPGLIFECSLDGKEFKPCSSPKKFRSLKRTKHLFAVRAVDAAGNRDPTPADRDWKIKKRKRKKKN
jgi:hypothetical protein